MDIERRTLLVGAVALTVAAGLPLAAGAAPAPLGLADAPGIGRTLLEMAADALGRDEIKRATVMQILARPELMGVLPFRTVQGGGYTHPRAYRGVLSPELDRLYVGGDDLETDMSMIKDHGMSIRRTQDAMKLNALARRHVDAYVNGVTWGSRTLDGPSERVLGLAERVGCGRGINQHGEPINPKAVDTILGLVDRPTHLLMSKKARMKLMRFGGIGSTWDRNHMGDRYALFRGKTPILVTDYNDTGEKIIPSNNGRAYALRIADDGVCGLQNDPPKVYDLGELQEKPVLCTRIEWLNTITVLGDNALAEVSGLGRS